MLLFPYHGLTFHYLKLMLSFDADGDNDKNMESEDDGYMQVEARTKEGNVKSSNAAANLKSTCTFFLFSCHFLKLKYKLQTRTLRPCPAVRLIFLRLQIPFYHTSMILVANPWLVVSSQALSFLPQPAFFMHTTSESKPKLTSTNHLVDRWTYSARASY